MPHLQRPPLVDAQTDLGQALNAAQLPHPDAYRLAFNDPEFMLRPEVRGIRLELEMLKPELELQHHHIDHTVVVYGSARVLPAEQTDAALASARAQGASAQDIAALQQRLQRGANWYEAARTFGHLVARHAKNQPRDQHLYICTGGGPGIMEAANRGAHEAGEPTIGLNVTLPHEQCANPYITPGLSFQFHYFTLRKMHFMLRAKALVVFPGGFGTLDELFELLTLVQTGKSRPVPIIMFDTAYWQRLIHFDALVDEGMIDAQDIHLMTFVDTAQDAWRTIADFYQLHS